MLGKLEQLKDNFSEWNISHETKVARIEKEKGKGKRRGGKFQKQKNRLLHDHNEEG